jgi:salicylate 5-hydroxylase small subunit
MTADAEALALEVMALNARYGRILDRGDWDAWPALFTEDGVYRICSRENHDAGLPLALLSLESRGMLLDRVYGISRTMFHDPYYQQHLIGTPVVMHSDEEGIDAEASFLVMRTKRDALPEVLGVGRYLDRIVRTGEGLRYRRRTCLIDNDLVANSVIYPL